MNFLNLMPANLFELCREFARQQLFGLAIASTTLCLCALVITTIARRKSAATRFLVWQMAGSGVLLASIALAATRGIPLRSASLDANAVENSISAPASVGTNPPREAIQNQNLTPAIAGNEVAPSSVELTRKLATPKIERDLPAKQVRNFAANAPAKVVPHVPVEQAASRFSAETSVVALVFVWAIVFVGHLVWFVGCVFCCYRIVSNSSNIRMQRALNALAAAKERIGAGSKSKVRLIASEQVSVPFTIGIVQPKIVLPVVHENWSAEKLEMVLAHELAHIQRRDVLWHWLNRLACCLAWFNPLIWIAAKRGIFEGERACDDRVIESGVAPIEYGQSLVEIAALMSGRQLRGGVSMAEPPLKQRLDWILAAETDRNTDRKKSSARFQISVAVLFLALTCIVGAIRPLAVAQSTVGARERSFVDESIRSDEPAFTNMSGESVDQDRADQDEASQDKTEQDSRKTDAQSRGLPPLEVETFEMTDSVSGVIQTHDGKPAAGVNVEVTMLNYGDRRRRQTVESKEYGKWKTKTDAKGSYTIDTSKIGEIPDDTRIRLDRIHHPNIVEDDPGRVWKAKPVSDTGKLGTFKLKKSRKVSGQIRDANGKPIQGIIRAVGVVADPNLAWFSRGLETDQNGRFKILVPADYQIQLMAIAPGHVAKHIAVPGNNVIHSDEPNLGNSLTLEELHIINNALEPKEAEAPDTNNAPFDTGTVTLETGTIVKGKLLDGQGQPIVGVVVGMETAVESALEYVSFDASFACLTDKAGSFEFPPATGQCYVFVDESIYPSDQVGSVAIRGKAPPKINPEKFLLDANVKTKELALREITASQKISGTIKWENGEPVAGVEVVGGAMPNVKYGSVFSNEKGVYEIEMPRTLKDAYITVMGANDERGVWHSAVGFRTSIDRRYGHYVLFDTLDRDEVGVNWELRELKSRPFDTPEYNKARAEFIQLKKLSFDLYKKLQAAEEAAKTPEEKEKAYRELDPRNAMAKHYLAFEKKHRGTRAAFLALNAGISSAVSVADPEIDASIGRNEMVSRLLEHYLDHEELSSVFDGLSAGHLMTDRDKILEMGVKHSPHRKVRAEALLYRAEFALKDLREAEMLPAYRKFVKEKMTKNLQQHQEQAKIRVKQLAAINQDELRAQALRWLDAVETLYADVRIDSYGSHYNKKMSEVVPRLRYALTNIITGKPAPEVEFTDIDGTEYRLSDLKGKPVVLTLSFDHGSKLDNQELAKKYAGKDVAFVTVIGANDADEFLKKFPRDELFGAIAIEPIFNGGIRANWYVNSPATFLIDKEGILRSNQSRAVSISDWVDEQLK